MIDLENIKVKIEEKDEDIVLLNSLLKSYIVFVDTMKYARDTLSLDDILTALKSKEIDNQNLKKSTV